MTVLSLSTNSPASRLATRLAFLAAGFSLSCWAPLVPYAKARLGVDDAALGLLLLCLGIGSVVAMPATAPLSNRYGTRPVILVGGLGMALALPALATVDTLMGMAAALLVFGASLGTLDVAMNVHATEVERDADRPLMSGFHGLFSVGGFAGSGGMTLLLASGLAPWAAAWLGAALVLVLLALASPRLLRTRAAEGERAPLFVRPRGIVIMLGILALVTFMTEGALLDWGALLMTDQRGVAPTQAGLGYTLFSLAMTTGRLTGDRVVAMLGGRRVLLWGGVATIAGLAVLLLSPWTPLAFSSFLLIGAGAANLVPVLFSAAGRQRVMPPALAVAGMTATGYAGMLGGPALIGFIARGLGLPAAFTLLSGLMLLVPLSAGLVGRVDDQAQS
ncbi:MFS transporter [Nitrospirillum iridis]|uniref:Putative MFS family arabinose efflux permease n=1 Tax=Nitrospirillum iridis TaxID=765888 RepID=A0A7X0EDQ2_9PROT|nr:MFS transporter [Nitrospirillum iridis]MBB6250619.1 putative MFS family arabinose efflux permease [Nitrospirillum iridis]